jgi:hypothetical protein
MSSQLSSEPTLDGTKLERRPAAAALEALDGPAWELDGPVLDVEPDCSGCDEGPASAVEEPKNAEDEHHQSRLRFSCQQRGDPYL